MPLRVLRTVIGAVLGMTLVMPAGARAEGAPLPPANTMIHAAPLQASASREAARLTLPPPAQTAPKRKNWAARHPVLLGTMAGAGIGLGFLAAEGCESSDYSCGGLVAFFAGTGALLGAGAGGIASIFLR